MAKAEEIIALDIGKASVKLVKIIRTLRSIQLTNVVLEDIPSRPNRDSSSEVIVEAVRKAFKKIDSAQGEVYLGLSGTKTAIKRLLVPHMPKDELPQAIRWAVKEQILFSVDSAALDFQILGEVFDNDGIKKFDVIAALADKGFIDGTINRAKNAGILSFGGIMPNAVAVANYVNENAGFKNNESVVIVDIGRDKTSLSFFKDKVFKFNREISVAGEAITQALTGTVTSYPKKIELNYTEAEDIKRHYGIPEAGTKELTDSQIPLSQIAILMRPVLERFLNEIKRSLDYYRTEFKEDKIDRIILIGGGANLKGIEQYLSAGLGIKAEKAMAPANFNFDKNSVDEALLQNNFCQFALSLGLAQNKPNGLNLIPKEFKLEKVYEVEKVSFRILGVTVGLILLVAFAFMHFRTIILQRRLLSLSSYSDKLRQVDNLTAKIDSRKQFLRTVIGKQADLTYALKVLSNVTPDEILLTRLTLDKKIEGLRLTGFVFVDESRSGLIVAEFLEELEASGFFSEVNLIQSKKTEKQGRPVAEFELTAKFQ